MAAPRAPEEGAWPRAVLPMIGLPVRIGDVTVGRIADVLFDPGFGRALGFVVAGRSSARHFLPFGAAHVEAAQVRARSAFTVFSTSELAFYLDHGSSVTAGPRSEVSIDRAGAVVPSGHAA